ncbi:MAG: S1 RNA-binding domain-containing protein [bacterium]|nr:S1 RNA-binding domain-containing protein [bacterium]
MISEDSSKTKKSLSMADLLASSYTKPLNLKHGDQVSGKIVGKTDQEYIVDLGAKAEGILNKREIEKELQVGDKIEGYVAVVENESGQVALATQKQVMGSRRVMEQSKRWQKFLQALERKSHLSGRVLEINKGGLVVEVDGMRGFLPSSHLTLENLIRKGGSLPAGRQVEKVEELVGREIGLTVMEVDPKNNRLIFTAKKKISPEAQEKMKSFEVGGKLKVKIAAVLPFGLFVFLEDKTTQEALKEIEGVIFSQEVSWEETEDLSKKFTPGEEIEAQITGKDEELGRVLLSLKRLSEDPFEKLSQDFTPDDVVKGTIMETNQSGMVVKLEGGMEGFLSASKAEGGSEYQVGQTTNFLVDSVDKNKRRINLVPFITSTKGLIYK